MGDERIKYRPKETRANNWQGHFHKKVSFFGQIYRFSFVAKKDANAATYLDIFSFLVN